MCRDERAKFLLLSLTLPRRRFSFYRDLARVVLAKDRDIIEHSNISEPSVLVFVRSLLPMIGVFAMRASAFLPYGICAVTDALFSIDTHRCSPRK
jgi:hypothetical protein